jgi:translocation protein SEC62
LNYSTNYKKFLLSIVIIGVLMICLMPVWPDYFKSAVLYVNIGLLYVLFGIMFLRLILYFIIRIFGVEFWLFPNYMEDVKILSLGRIL